MNSFVIRFRMDNFQYEADVTLLENAPSPIYKLNIKGSMGSVVIKNAEIFRDGRRWQQKESGRTLGALLLEKIGAAIDFHEIQ